MYENTKIYVYWKVYFQFEKSLFYIAYNSVQLTKCYLYKRLKKTSVVGKMNLAPEIILVTV